MKITINTKDLLQSIQKVVGVVEKKQTMPILSHILFKSDGKVLSLTATDLEVQISSKATPESIEKHENFFTVSGRKLFDILKALDDQRLLLELIDDKLTISTNKSKYRLATLLANEFPVFEEKKADESFGIKQADLLNLFNKTQFSMAQQDVRFYLNGMLVEIEPNKLTTVATDGHRLAKAVATIEKGTISNCSFILPRKAIQELTRTMTPEKDCKISFSNNQASFDYDGVSFTTKLIDGKFPDYKRVVPDNTSRNILLDNNTLRPALQRVSILANEKFRGVRIELVENEMIITSENPEQEEAKESIDLKEEQQPLVLGFNVSYLIDAVTSCEGQVVCMGLNDENSSALITDPSNPNIEYVVMPMRL
jgi:DNA polymerase III subunit beta